MLFVDIRKKSNKSYNHLGIELGKKIAESRKVKGLTQSQLAEIVKVEPVSLSRIETGSVLPSLARLHDIAEALDIDVLELISASRPNLNAQSTELEGYLSTIAPDDRALIINWVKVFCKRLENTRAPNLTLSDIV